MLRFVAAFAVVGLFAAATCDAADPVFSSISPTAVQRGGEVTVQIRGDRLADVVDIVTNDGGVEMVSITPNEKDARRRAELKLKIAANAPLGIHRIRLRTKTGLSNLKSFHVTDVPVILEDSKLTGFSEAQPVEQNTAVVGRIDREDVDYFRYTLKKGQRFSAEVVGTRLGNSAGTRYFDPYLALLNSERFEIAISDDEALTRNDPFFSVVIPKDGDYTLEVRDSAYNGDGNSHYVLHAGTFPRPASITPLGGKPGSEVEITLVGDPRGEKTTKVTLPNEPGEFAFYPQDENGIAPTPHVMKVEQTNVVAEVEPNNDPYSQGTPSELPAFLTGVIEQPGDYDCFQFEAKKGQRFVFTAIAREARSPIDAVLHGFDVAKRKYLGGADDIGNNPDSRYEFTAPSDGKFAVRIYDHLKRGGPEYSYIIRAEMQSPTLKGDVVELERYKQPRWVVPSGGAVGRRIVIGRRNFGGLVKADFQNLPAGVRVEFPEVWGKSSQVPIVLFADETAEPSHTFAKLGLVKADDSNINGLITQKITQVRWRNNDRVIEQYFEELPVVVTEKAPFKVWIEEPKEPAVPDGWVDLTVRCEKAEGFDQDIRVELLVNPPGCSSSRSLKIAKGKDRVTMRVTAGGKAQVGRWDVCARAWANHDGIVETCTPFVPLHVADRWVDMKFQQAAVERGKEATVVVDVTNNEAFPGDATVKLLGLPAKTSAEPVKMKAGDTQLAFTVKTDEAAPVGTHKSLYLVAEIPVQVGVEPVPETPAATETVKVAFIEGDDKPAAPAEPTKDQATDAPAQEAPPAAKPEPKRTIKIVSHQFRGGKLRIDKPLPPKPAAKAKPAAKKPEPKKEAPKKPLSRLEMLRQQKAGG